MTLSQKITTARKKKGLTQEELADEAKITVRTIQRIEAGETVPRPFTLKAIAAALDINFEELVEEEPASTISPGASPADSLHFLSTLCLSCFCYLVIPWVHFLVPHYLLKRRKEKDPVVLEQGRAIIRTQVFWSIALQLLLLLTLAYNFIQKIYFGNGYFLHYLWLFFIMYFTNAFIILNSWRRVKHMNFENQT